MAIPHYTILETEIGPVISESRVTVFDVLEAQLKGRNLFEICAIYNLAPRQVQVALEYIDAHRAVLEAELAIIQATKAEREAHYRALAAERQAVIDHLPITPRRAAFQALRERNREQPTSQPARRRIAHGQP